MKTPNEIKKGLECRIRSYTDTCNHQCDTCDMRIPAYSIFERYKDALALIQQLEAQNAELLKKVEQLQAERDAAVKELKTCVNEAAQGDNFDCCFACKYNNKYGGCDRPNTTIECCGIEEFDNKWEWRGVQKEE